MLSPVSLLTELDAFLNEHRRCGELDGGVDGPTVWIACECGAALVHVAPFGYTTRAVSDGGANATDRAPDRSQLGA